MERIADKQEHDLDAQAHNGRRGSLTVFTCPECGGSLWQLDEDRVLRFRCHVGHSYTGDALLADRSAVLEAALWVAIRSFREKGVLSRQLAAQALQAGDADAAERHNDAAELADRQGELIRQIVGNGHEQPVNKDPQ
jgi:two-component system chemotaxis response regulator CheB